MEAASRDGLNLRASEDEQTWIVIAATRILIDMLGGHAPNRASKAAQWTHDFFENALKRNPTELKIDCAKGCAMCCHLSISAMAPEIFLAANAVRAQAGQNLSATLARMRTTERASHGLGAYQRAKKWVPCVMLENNACSVYASRPGPCRGTSSISVNACERAFRGENVGIPTPALWTTLHGVHVRVLWAALVATELPSETYEFNASVCVALETENAEARWLKGEDIFASVARMQRDDPATIAHNKKVIATLAARALGKDVPG
jgi:Fe-S-cluster containining protein